MLIELKMAIDPGASGAMVAQLPNGSVEVYKTSKMTEKDIYDAFMDVIARSKVMPYCVLERQHAMPKNGSIGNFKVGYNYGLWSMALLASKVSYKEIAPASWMKLIPGNVPSGKDSRPARKKFLKAHAERSFPQVRKVTLDDADALSMLSVWDKIWAL